MAEADTPDAGDLFGQVAETSDLLPLTAEEEV
jgi:hypothetical protein